MNVGRKALGIRLRSPSPAAIELCAGEDVDFVYLDCERGSFDLHDVEDACRAAELAGFTVVTRVPQCDPGLIGRFLDAGVQGMIVPHISSAREAEAAVRACRYPPLGERAYASARSNDYLRHTKDFARHFAESNANVTLSVQLEDVDAWKNAAAIAAVGGITYFTIGKHDLTASMGLIRQAEGFPDEVKAAVAEMEAAIRRQGGKLKDDVMTVGHVEQFILTGVRSLRASIQ